MGWGGELRTEEARIHPAGHPATTATRGRHREGMEAGGVEKGRRRPGAGAWRRERARPVTFPKFLSLNPSPPFPKSSSLLPSQTLAPAARMDFTAPSYSLGIDLDDDHGPPSPASKGRSEQARGYTAPGAPSFLLAIEPGARRKRSAPREAAGRSGRGATWSLTLSPGLDSDDDDSFLSAGQRHEQARPNREVQNDYENHTHNILLHSNITWLQPVVGDMLQPSTIHFVSQFEEWASLLEKFKLMTQ